MERRKRIETNGNKINKGCQHKKSEMRNSKSYLDVTNEHPATDVYVEILWHRQKYLIFGAKIS